MKSQQKITLMVSLLWGLAFFPMQAFSGNRIEAAGIKVDLSPNGEITRVFLGDGAGIWDLAGHTSLAGCQLEGRVISEQAKDGSVQFRKKLTCDIQGVRRETDLIEVFSPTKNSVRWDIELDGTGASWSTAIETRLHFPNAEQARFWTAWGSPKPDDDFVRNSSWKVLRQRANDWLYGFEGWEDPLTPAPFMDRRHGTALLIIGTTSRELIMFRSSATSSVSLWPQSWTRKKTLASASSCPPAMLFRT